MLRKKFRYVFVLIFIVSLGCKDKQSINKKFIGTTSNNYHGQIIFDEYRKLENLKDSSVIKWFKNQSVRSNKILENIPNSPQLVSLQKEILGTQNEFVSNVLITKNNKFFYFKRLSTQKFSDLYYKNGLNGEETYLFGSSDIEKDFYISYFRPDWNGNKVIIAFSKNGDEFSELRVLDVKSKTLLPLKISNCLPSYGGAYWSPNSEAILYNKVRNTKDKKDAYMDMEFIYHPLNSSPRKMFSRINNPDIEMKPVDIPIVYIEDPDEKFFFGAVAGATIYQDYYYTSIENIENNKKEWKKLFSKKDKVTSFVRDKDSVIYISSLNASNFQICKTSLSSPDTNNPRIIVPMKKNEIIRSLRLIKEGIVYTTIKNGVEAKIFLIDSLNKTKELTIPVKAGNISVQTKGKKYNYLSIIVEGWLSDRKRYEYDFEEKKFKKAEISKISSYYNTDDFEVKELEIPSHDGNSVPLSLIYKKSVELNSHNSVLMIAYGAYGVSITPSFSEKILTWVSEGGVFAVSHVRGGREKGDLWYKNGFKNTKANSWKDLISSAEYLIEKKYTSEGRIAINGASAGAITIGRAMTERPDLFGASIIDVGFLNMIRAETGYNGKNNTKEFGTVENKEEFQYLMEMDSYYHIEKGKEYPASLITSGINDSRVPPWHSAKFAAKLQDFSENKTPILLKIDFDTGHSNTASDKRLESVTNVLSFAFWQTGHPDYQPK
ncbi:prolyl oligopeptidase family serine peptidase [Aquimarina amphilecti]|nr:prolyl oligopeptidase family serine peptidase [Aquimarina amphilecti]